MRIAHFTDLHLPIPKAPPATALLNKRFLGYRSWRRKRSKTHQLWALEALVEDAKAQGCDAVLISGDIVNIALPNEFDAALAWLETHFSWAPVTMVPGNHDTYVPVHWMDGLGKLNGYMRGWPSLSAAHMDAQSRSGPDDFPFIADLGHEKSAGLPLCVIAVNSSPPTAPGLASGKLGAAQRQKLETLLEDAKQDGLYRVILLHHPVGAGVVSRRKALSDDKAFRHMIARAGAELVLHGHTHFPVRGTLPGPAGEAIVIGGGSCSHAKAGGRYSPAQYNIFDFTNTNRTHPKITLTVRELNLQSKTVETVEQNTVSAPAVA
ncbi:MAG: metallophosphoesterase family protein [Sphingomonadales bacterium]